MASIIPQTHIKRAEANVLDQLLDDGDVVIVRLDDGGEYALDPVGGTILDLADGMRTIAEIATAACELYEDTTPDVVLQDTLELVKQLLNNGLTSIAEDKPS